MTWSAAFAENDVPLDVFVIDMDWHLTFGRGAGKHLMDRSGHVMGWGGYRSDKLLFPDPRGIPGAPS